MAKIVVIDREGAEHEIEGTVGWSVMEVVREASLPIEAACGGCCACATCHVYVDQPWLDKLDKPDADEELMLDEAFEVQDNSRLSCQIKLSDELDGIRITLAPDF
ncbi:MAG: 2Fe-2S iron-sulfur cluster binding domain-containing protein [Geminicoccaceae bacterium]|nr:2Fe-2S iron-sulfur cluster binding domain-containing protein [Geminicoccaceae bacterium]